MSETSLFLTGVGMTVSAALLVVLYLRGPLDRLLVELCGTAERARFWSAFSAVSLVLVPLIVALDFHPDIAAGDPPVIGIAMQLKGSLSGLVATSALLAIILSRFIPRVPASASGFGSVGKKSEAGGAI